MQVEAKCWLGLHGCLPCSLARVVTRAAGVLASAPCMVLTFGSRCYAFRLRGSARLPREAAAQISRPLPRLRGGRPCRQQLRLLFRNSPV
jgi:hypothetical protein